MTGQRTDRPLYGIDAGGSHTSVRAWNGDRWTVPPLNPSTVGQDESASRLAGLFTRIRQHAEQAHGRSAIWLASASMGHAAAGSETRRYAAAAREAGLDAEILLSNDVTPLMLGSPAGTGHMVTVCGTGSCFLATDGRSAVVRVGGYEYLASDEGSAFGLGLAGLRAAVRGLDGRGPATVLADLLAEHARMPVTALARKLAQQPFPKSPVAALAPVVLRAWLDGDPVAAEVTSEAIGELRLGMRAARDAARLSPGWFLSVTGGVGAGCPDFFGRLATAAAELGAGPVELVADPAVVALAALGQLSGTGPLVVSDPRVNRDVWYVAPEGASSGDIRV